jgi:hypothetical protein
LARDFSRAMQPYATEAIYVNYLETGAKRADRAKEARRDSYDPIGGRPICSRVPWEDARRSRRQMV